MEIDITIKRGLLMAAIVASGLFTIPFTRPLVQPLLDYELIGFVTPGLVVGIGAIAYVILRYRKEI